MKTKGIIWFIIAVLVVIAIQLVFGFMVRNHFGSWNAGGTFGDTFGALNALFAGLAFAGVIIAIFLQSKELELQRKELQQTREELKGQKEQLQSQNETLRLQSFENTFFQMLRFHNEVVDKMKTAAGGGRGSFDFLLKAFTDRYKNLSTGAVNDDLKQIKASIKGTMKPYRTEIQHYLRSLLSIFKFLKNRIPLGEELHSKILEAQFSNYELVFLFYLCLIPDNQQLKKLLEEFSFFENMEPRSLIDLNHRHLYDRSAFGKGLDGIVFP